MRCKIQISRRALKENFKALRNLAGDSKIIPVLKSNAYGHGFAEVYQVISELKPFCIGVNYVSEAIQLRELGYTGRLLIVGTSNPAEFSIAESLNIEVPLTSPEVFLAWFASSRKPKAHIKIDTGLNRQGFLPFELHAHMEQLVKCKHQLVGVCSHFANVEDVTQQDYAYKQLETFSAGLRDLEAAGLTHLERHIAASAPAILMDCSLFDYIRPGISLYGFWPSHLTKISYQTLQKRELSLTPVLSWRTEITQLKQVPAGSFIGYGCTFKAPKELTVAVIPVGYYEGYPRLAGDNRAFVLVNGQRCDILGRICMNMMMVDVSHVLNAQSGDSVTLIGKDDEDEISVEMVANWANTIQYELVTRLNPSIPREIV